LCGKNWKFGNGVMDQATNKGSGEMLDHVDKGIYDDLSHLVEGVATDAGAGHNWVTRLVYA
jgi:hypothetical protein